MKLISLFLILSYLPLCVSAKDRLNLVTGIIPPYQDYAKDKQLIGKGIDALECITEKMDIESSIQVHSWKRAQHLVKDGAADGFFVASKNSQRDKYAIFSSPILKSKWLWISNLNSSKTLNKELSRVGTIKGTNMAHFQTKNFKNVILSKELERLVLLVQKNRLDRIMCTPDMFKEVIQKMSLRSEDFKIEVAMDRPLGVYFGKHFIKRHPEFLEKFNHAASKCYQ